MYKVYFNVRQKEKEKICYQERKSEHGVTSMFNVRMFCGAECSHQASETFTANLKPCSVYSVRGLLATGTGVVRLLPSPGPRSSTLATLSLLRHNLSDFTLDSPRVLQITHIARLACRSFYSFRFFLILFILYSL